MNEPNRRLRTDHPVHFISFYRMISIFIGRLHIVASRTLSFYLSFSPRCRHWNSEHNVKRTQSQVQNECIQNKNSQQKSE